jgi:hypothetical protein
MLSKDILLLPLAFINLIVAGLVFSNKRHIVNKLFAIFICFVVAWILSLFAVGVTFGKATNLLWGRIIFVPSILVALSFLWFADVFPDSKNIILKRKLLAFTFLGFVIVVLSFSPAMVSRILYTREGHYRPIYGPLYPLFSLYLLSCFGYALFILGRKWRKACGMSKLQIRYLFWGAFLFWGSGIITNVIIPLLFHTSRFSFYGPYFSIFFVGFTAYAITLAGRWTIRSPFVQIED